MISHAFHQSFSEPVCIGPRRFDADYLLCAAEGAFILETGGRRWVLPPHRAALIPAGMPISVRSTGPTRASSVLFEVGLFKAVAGCRVFGLTGLARQMVDHAMRWAADRGGGDADADAFFTALAYVVRQLAAVEDETWLPQPGSAAIARAVEAVLAGLDRDIPLENLASLAGMSERTFARRFDDELGMGLREFRQRARMIRAKEALAASGRSVTVIAFDCGFASTSSFIKAFRAFAGVTPARYRAFGR